MQEENESQQKRKKGFDLIATAILGIVWIVFEQFSQRDPTKKKEKNADTDIAKFTGQVAFWTKILAGVGILTAAVLTLQLCTLEKTDHTLNKTLVAANRAWIAPIVGRFEDTPLLDNPISVIVEYQNVGHEPALNMNLIQRMRKENLTSSPSGGFDFTAISNPTCDNLSPSPGGQTVYPSDFPIYGSGFHTGIMLSNDLAKQPGGYLFWYGCFKYETFNFIGTSGYCFWLPPIKDKAVTEWVWNFCPRGNRAN